eukprot:scaffold27423_cov64-Phaeocystis_antarctica.AAC.5
MAARTCQLNFGANELIGCDLTRSHVFSAASTMHGDLSKSAKDMTLEHSLFAAFNTEVGGCAVLVTLERLYSLPLK